MNETAAIFQYVRNKENQRVGYLAGTSAGIGWSKAHWPVDDFDHARGRTLAVDRSKLAPAFLFGQDCISGVKARIGSETIELHSDVARALPEFIARYAKYFGKSVTV